jgi:hypothetical protein
MRTDSFVVAEMLQRMEQQSQLLRPRAVDIATALNKDAYPTALEATEELHHALNTFVSTSQVLQGHVVAHDGMGALGESLGELALRARGLVVRAQLDVLCEELRDPAAQARARGWFAGRLRSIADVDAFLRDRLDHLQGLWLPYRQDKPQQPGMTDADRSTLYRTMVRVAQRALQALRDEPDLARFLDGGLLATDLIQIHLACRQLVTVLGLRLDVEPASSLLRRSRRIAINGSSSSSTADGTPIPGKDAAEGC